MTGNKIASLIVNTSDAEKKLNDLLLKLEPTALERLSDLVSHDGGDVFLNSLFDVVDVDLSQDVTAVGANAHGIVCAFNIVIRTEVLAAALGASDLNL